VYGISFVGIVNARKALRGSADPHVEDISLSQHWQYSHHDTSRNPTMGRGTQGIVIEVGTSKTMQDDDSKVPTSLSSSSVQEIQTC
jgi:hypothetical protein